LFITGSYSKPSQFVGHSYLKIYSWLDEGPKNGCVGPFFREAGYNPVSDHLESIFFNSSYYYVDTLQKNCATCVTALINGAVGDLRLMMPSVTLKLTHDFRSTRLQDYKKRPSVKKFDCSPVHKVK
jgi:hypothetical protein